MKKLNSLLNLTKLKKQVIAFGVTLAMVLVLLPLGGMKSLPVLAVGELTVKKVSVETAIFANGNAITVKANATHPNLSFVYLNSDLVNPIELSALATSSGCTIAGDITNGYNLQFIEIYGGSYMGSVASTNVTIENGLLFLVCGGGYKSAVTGDTNLIINGGTFNAFTCGGGFGDTIGGSINTTINGGTFVNVFNGGNCISTINGNVNLTVNGGTIGSVFGAGTQTIIDGSTNVNINGGTVGGVMGGGQTCTVKGNTNVNINGGTVNLLYRDGSYNSITEKTSNIIIGAGSTVNTIYPIGKYNVPEGSILINYKTNISEVSGNAVLSSDLTIPSGMTLTIPSGATLTVPSGLTLTNNGTIINNGTVDGTVSGTPIQATAPAVPINVSAIKGVAIAKVSFTAQSDGGSPITGYTVTSNPGGITGTGTSSPITVTGLSPGTSYTFTVTATNNIGTSAPSTASSAITIPTVPDAPTDVSAVAGDQKAVVSFTAPASNGGSAITGYTVTSNSGGITATGTSSPITVTGLSPGTSYTFTVRAINDVGTSLNSAISNSVTPKKQVIVPAVTTPAQTTTEQPTVTTTAEFAPEPSIGGTKGWTKIEEIILNANLGDILSIDMNGTTSVPQRILSDLKGKDVTVKFNFGTYTWEINGKDITTAQSVDGGLTYTPNVVSSDLVGGVAGNSLYIQFQLNYNGSFGFTGKLTVHLPAEMAGQYANLYYYNPKTKKLELYASALIGKDGKATFNFSHASDYVVVMEKTSKSSNLSAGESVADNAKPIEQNGIPYLFITVVMILAGIAVMKYKKAE